MISKPGISQRSANYKSFYPVWVGIHANPWHVLGRIKPCEVAQHPVCLRLFSKDLATRTCSGRTGGKQLVSGGRGKGLMLEGSGSETDDVDMKSHTRVTGKRRSLHCPPEVSERRQEIGLWGGQLGQDPAALICLQFCFLINSIF